MAFIPIYDTNPLVNIKRPWVAWTLLAVNIVVYFAVEVHGIVGTPTHASVMSLGLIPAVFNGYAPSEYGLPDVVTLVTYAFLHGDFWHLAGNMIFLWVLADNVEDALGHTRFLIFYLLCAIAGGYAYVLSDPASAAPVIGASGAIAGCISAYLLLHPKAKMWVLVFARIPIRLSAVYVLGFWIVVQAASAIGGGDSEVAWWTHIGGLLAGTVLVVVMKQRGVRLFDRGSVAIRTAPAATGVAGKDEMKGPWQ
jgi:membrane associated rhomboid family serine protease